MMWDEYDAKELGWVASFLGPMWDGKYWNALGPQPIGVACWRFLVAFSSQTIKPRRTTFSRLAKCRIS